MKIINLIIALILISSISCNEEVDEDILKQFEDGPLKDYFEVYHKIYKKDYIINSEEGQKRFKAFEANVKLIKETNALNLTYTFGINKFSDLTVEEFREKHLMKSEDVEKSLQAFRNLDEKKEFLNSPRMTQAIKSYPNVDWTPYLGAIRYGGNVCSAGPYFAATGAIEALLGKKQGRKAAYLSPQELLDCTGFNKCQGIDLTVTLQYIKTFGVFADSKYKYTGVPGTCKSYMPFVTKTKINYSFCSTNPLTTPCTEDLVHSYLQEAPIPVYIDGSAIQNYRAGIFKGSCSSINHVVLMVGYKSTSDGQGYFIIRNSWDNIWGELGYMRLARNESNNQSCFTNSNAFLISLA